MSVGLAILGLVAVLLGLGSLDFLGGGGLLLWSLLGGDLRGLLSDRTARDKA